MNVRFKIQIRLLLNFRKYDISAPCGSLNEAIRSTTQDIAQAVYTFPLFPGFRPKTICVPKLQTHGKNNTQVSHFDMNIVSELVYYVPKPGTIKTKYISVEMLVW